MDDRAGADPGQQPPLASVQEQGRSRGVQVQGVAHHPEGTAVGPNRLDFMPRMEDHPVEGQWLLVSKYPPSLGFFGLECGLLTEKYPDLDIVSFGPNITGAHSPDERCQISSVQKIWKLFAATMGQLAKS